MTIEATIADLSMNARRRPCGDMPALMTDLHQSGSKTASITGRARRRAANDLAWFSVCCRTTKLAFSKPRSASREAANSLQWLHRTTRPVKAGA
jgi:hypothetical protein